MNQPPYIIEDVFTDIVSAVAAKLAKPVYFYACEVKELNETLQQYNDDPANYNKKYPLVLLKTGYKITSSKLPQLYGEIPELTLFVIVGTDPNYKRKERDTVNYIPTINPIVAELKNQTILSKAFLGYPSQFKTEETKYPYWGEKQKNVLSDISDVSELKYSNLKIQNNLNC